MCLLRVLVSQPLAVVWGVAGSDSVVQLLWSLFLPPNHIISVCSYIVQSLLQGELDITLCCVVSKWCSGKLRGAYVCPLGVLHVCTWIHAHFVLLHRYTVCNIPALTLSHLFCHFCCWIACFVIRTIQAIMSLETLRMVYFAYIHTFNHKLRDTFGGKSTI